MVKFEKARLEEDNSQDICYILDKMNKFDQSLIKEHDVKGITFRNKPHLLCSDQCAHLECSRS